MTVSLEGGQLVTTKLQNIGAGPSINETSASLDKVREDVVRVKCGKVTSINFMQ